MSLATTIDFRDSSWSVPFNTTTTKTVGDTTITATPSGAKLWQDSIDGIAIVYDYENDEIEADERLEVSFLEQKLLSTIYIADLFIEKRNGFEYAETGSYSTNSGGSWTEFVAVQSTGTNGELTIDVGGVLTDSILFQAPGIVTVAGYRTDQEFAVQKLVMAAVPEPSTMLLLGIGLIGLAGRGVRRRLKGERK